MSYPERRHRKWNTNPNPNLNRTQSRSRSKNQSQSQSQSQSQNRSRSRHLEQLPSNQNHQVSLPQIPEVSAELSALHTHVRQSSSFVPRLVHDNGKRNCHYVKEPVYDEPFRQSFPQKIMQLLKLFPGNDHCPDCSLRLDDMASDQSVLHNSDESGDLSWASLQYGTLICKKCAYCHFKLDLNTCVQSLENSHWTLPKILSLLEGGNGRMLKYLSNEFEIRLRKKNLRQLFNANGSLLSGESDRTILVADEYKHDFVTIAFKRRYESRKAQIYREDLQNRITKARESHDPGYRKEVSTVEARSQHSYETNHFQYRKRR